MHLTRTKPQPKLPDTDDPRAWQGGNGYHPGYGEEEAAPGASPSAGYEDDLPATGRVRHKRRWPIVSAVLVLLVLVVGGGLIGGWQYVRGQYYIGTQAGNVAIFRGVNQDVAGISLSSLLQQYPALPVAQLGTDARAQVSQTISYGSLQDAQSVVSRLQQQATQCQRGYQALATWQVADIKYKQALVAYNKLPAAAKKSKKKPASPPAEPAAPPSAAECAPSTAFGIPASALPPAQTGGVNPAAAPSASPGAAPSAKAAPSPGKSA